jgi:hypothetical protein
MATLMATAMIRQHTVHTQQKQPAPARCAMRLCSIYIEAQ